MGDGKAVIIVGGGLVGSLCANFMAKRGYQVEVYEKREDIRLASLVQGRSINLSLSNRGRQALSVVNLEEDVLEQAIPMKGRLLHSLTGELRSVPYDRVTNQCIYSVSRRYLNEALLTAVEKYPNVKLFFDHKLVSADVEGGTISVLNKKTQELKYCTADLIIGADGAFSALRRFLQQTPLFQFSQSYIEHGYLELCIPSRRGTEMIPNHLHIWPRGEFMMIALPNKDTSWTVTLFMPFTRFKLLDSAEKLRAFFAATFPDALPLIGEEELTSSFFRVPPSPLVTVKCKPYHAGRKFLIIGDAAHAMVPFYGQGMNAGFEDCFVLDGILDENGEDVQKSIAEFSERREGDVHAICDLALYNYEEMRDLVMRRSYRARKVFDEFMFRLLPDIWIPLYNSVTFSNMGYRECVENRKRQDMVIQKICWAVVLFFCVVSSLILSVYLNT